MTDSAQTSDPNDILSALELIYKRLVGIEKSNVDDATTTAEISQLKLAAIALHPDLESEFKNASAPASVLVNDVIRDLINNNLSDDPGKLKWNEQTISSQDPNIQQQLNDLFKKAKG